ncbi:hypothetical protein [Microbacterium sp. T2.11-28]|uniref:hypothetical protein n=1 Tax=Microbacterium sp. T2.11-28 TaxID=3041169 RepID=UPI0025404210|nr:hypothetical protein [Microbacterium sp. T2.11-28]
MTNTGSLAADLHAVDAVVDELVEIRRGMAALQAREAAVLARAVAVVRAQEDVPGPSGVRDVPLRGRWRRSSAPRCECRIGRCSGSCPTRWC